MQGSSKPNRPQPTANGRLPMSPRAPHLVRACNAASLRPPARPRASQRAIVRLRSMRPGCVRAIALVSIVLT